MTNKQFYVRLTKDLYENTHPDHREMIKDLKITSLEQVLGIFRSVMIRNRMQYDESKYLNKELKKMMDVLGLTERDL